MIESRTSLKNIAASTMTAFTPVMIVLTAVNCVVMDKDAHVLDNRLLSGHPTHPYYIEKESTI